MDGRICDWDVQVRDDDHTREAFTVDRYFRTGDIGHVTPQGAVVITDPKKDLIIRGGKNLSARESEDILHGHPDIQEAAAVSMPHDRLGEGVCAYLVMKPGCRPVAADALQACLSEVRLAGQKWPERIEIRESLPRTASGKVREDRLRRELRKLLAPCPMDGHTPRTQFTAAARSSRRGPLATSAPRP